MNSDVSAVDCIIIGAGPAGLTAAIYLARFRRSVVVLDRGAPRAAWIPLSHNIPGYPAGVSGNDLLDAMRRQATAYNTRIIHEEVVQLQRLTDHDQASSGLQVISQNDGEHAFVAKTASGRMIRGHTVLLATGVIDREPELPHLKEAVSRHLIRHCAVCDAFEVIGQKIAVLDSGDEKGINESTFLRAYSQDVTLLTCGGKPVDRQRCDQLGIRLRCERIASVEVAEEAVPDSQRRDNASSGAGNDGGEVQKDQNDDGQPSQRSQDASSSSSSSRPSHEKPQCVRVSFSDGTSEVYDTCYSALGFVSRSDLAVQLGAELADDGRLLCPDPRMMTSVEGLYCAGDCVHGLNQVAVAEGQAAIAATAINTRLSGANILSLA